MRILFLNQVFYPDHAATAQHLHDLTIHLAAAGHDVRVIASRSLYGRAGASLPREMVDGVKVTRVGRSVFGKAGLLARSIDFGIFYVRALVAAFWQPRPDVVVCLTTPPFIAVIGWLLRKVRRTKFIYWVMDVYPDVPIACGVLDSRSILARLLSRLDLSCLQAADRVVVLGRCMRSRILDKGVPARRVQQIGVWSDQEELRPISRSENEYTHKWDLDNAFTVMYSGNFGLAHDVKTMLLAAERLRGDPQYRFLLVGSGKRKKEVEEFCSAKRLQNVVLDDYQPRSKLAMSLSSGDVHLVTMKAGLEGLVVPCKLFGIMAAARPTVFIGSPQSELAMVLQEHDAGIVVSPGDVDSLVKAITDLATNPDVCRKLGENARRALASAYDRARACEKWQNLLESVAAETG